MLIYNLVSLATLTVASSYPADDPPATPDPVSSYAFYGITPTQVTFESSGTPIVGYHYAPNVTADHGAPAVLVAHGLGGLQTSRIMPFAAAFAQAGYHALTFDYRYWGFSSGHPRNIISIPSQAADYQAAAEFMTNQTGVDGRIVLWGTSLSGGNVLQIAGQGAIKNQVATIAQCPEVNGFYTVSLLPPKSLPGLIAAGIRDAANAAAEGLGLSAVQPYYIPLANYTGEFGALTQAGAYEGYQFVQPNPPPPGNVFPARFVTELPFFSPEYSAPTSTLPTFIAVGLTDNIVGFKPQEALARKMNASLHEYPGGHFSVYYGASQYDAILSDQIAFLQENVPLS